MAVVALTTVDTPDISQPGEGTDFGRVDDVQIVVDGLLAGNLGGERGKKVKRVIALTHIGYEEDMRLAKNSRFVRRRSRVCFRFLSDLLFLAGTSTSSLEGTATPRWEEKRGTRRVPTLPSFSTSTERKFSSSPHIDGESILGASTSPSLLTLARSSPTPEVQ